MFTCREEFGRDASELFNRLTGYSRFPDYQKLVPAPESIREFVYSRIDREIEHKKKGLPAGIFIKINSLLDKGMVDRPVSYTHLDVYKRQGCALPIHYP